MRTRHRNVQDTPGNLNIVRRVQRESGGLASRMPYQRLLACSGDNRNRSFRQVDAVDSVAPGVSDIQRLSF